MVNYASSWFSKLKFLSLISFCAELAALNDIKIYKNIITSCKWGNNDFLAPLIKPDVLLNPTWMLWPVSASLPVADNWFIILGLWGQGCTVSGCQVASLGRGEMLCRKQLAGLMAAPAASGAALKLIGKGLSRQQVQASLRISRWDHQGWPWLVSALSDLSTATLVLRH